MFSADFAYNRLKKWISEPEKRIGIVCNDMTLVVSMLCNDFDCTWNPMRRQIEFPNRTRIDFFKIQPSDEMGCQMRGFQWHYVWLHNSPSFATDLACYGARLGEYPEVLVTR